MPVNVRANSNLTVTFVSLLNSSKTETSLCLMGTVEAPDQSSQGNMQEPVRNNIKSNYRHRLKGKKDHYLSSTVRPFFKYIRQLFNSLIKIYIKKLMQTWTRVVFRPNKCDVSDFSRVTIVAARPDGLSISKTVFFTQQSLEFTENGAKNKQHPKSGSSVCENALLMREENGQIDSSWLATASQRTILYNSGMQKSISEHNILYCVILM